MKRWGGALTWMGLAPLAYQAILWFENGRWTSFSLIDLCREVGFEPPFIVWTLVRTVVQQSLRTEVGLVLLACGLLIQVVPPLRRMAALRRAARLVARERYRREVRTKDSWIRIDFRNAS